MKVRRSNRILSLLIALIMIFVSFPISAFASKDFNSAIKKEGGILTEGQRDALKLIDRSMRPSGLVGFESNWDLDKFHANEDLSVIVEFVHQPAILQQYQENLSGRYLSLSQAETLAENDHDQFIRELNSLFSISPQSRSGARGYNITASYTDAINGVALKLPASMVKELTKLDSVHAVYPDEVVQTDPVNEERFYPDKELASQVGMADTRIYLGIDKLHDKGIKGRGVVVGVLDTGVDYNHPDLADAFSDQYMGSDENMQAIDGKYYGRNFINYEEAGMGGFAPESPYDPMETSYDAWISNGENYPETNETGNTFYTSHGTHVAGTIAGRGVNQPISALGMAPEASLLSYRVLGPYGSGYTSWILAGLDKVAIDGCDVVNMSLGAAINNPAYATSLAVNNLAAQYDIVFAISSGNSGPGSSTLGSPGTSSLAITVGNGTVDVLERTVDIYTIYEEEGLEEVDELEEEIEEIEEEIDEIEEKEIEEAEEIENRQANVIDDSDEIEEVDETEDQEEEVEESEEIDEEYKEVEEGQEPIESGRVEMRLLTSGYTDIESMGDGSWYMSPDLDELELILIPGDSGVLINGREIGIGSEDEFEAVARDVRGKIAVVSRGQAFVSTAEIAKEYGAAAVIVITNDDGLYYGFQDANDRYVPLFLTRERAAAIEIIELAMDNGGWLKSENYLEGVSYGGELNDSSSRGPVGTTMDIKPDIVGPGTQVLSTVPYWETNERNKTNPFERDAYDYAYLRYTGTSMSSPHVAGIAALLLGENPTWSLAQVKARIMNTADPMEGYSVHEVGTGYINPGRALDATSYFTVDYDGSLYPDDIVFADMEMASLNFGVVPVDLGRSQEIKLNLNLYNEDYRSKTYDISHISNHSGFRVSNEGSMIASRSKWESAGIELDYDRNVSLDGNSSETISVSLIVGENASNDHLGIYEGYLLIDNDFAIPFSASLVNSNFFTRTFLNQPVLTTTGVEDVKADGSFSFDADRVHFEKSFYSDLYFSLEQGVTSMFVIYASADIEDPWDQEKWIGEAGVFIDGSLFEPDRLYVYRDVVGPIYIKYDDSPGGYSVAALDPGHYKAIVFANTWMGVELSEPMDFYVDNELANLSIDGLEEDRLVYESEDIQKATITGNIYDKGLDYLRENGFTYEMYDSDADYHGPRPDQALNAIFAKTPGSSEYIQAKIEANGDFVLELTGLSSSGTTEIELYYLDSFSAAQFSTEPSAPKLSPGFNPSGPSLNSYYGSDYAFYGLNKGLKTITLEHQGAFIEVNPASTALEVGEEVQLRAELSEDAIEEGFTQVGNWISTDENIAKVDENGLVTAVSPGTASISVRARNPEGRTISGSAKVTVIGIGDGVSLPLGAKVFLGAGEYENYNADTGNKDKPVGDERFPYASEYSPLDDKTTMPYYWQVMGEEKIDGVGDGYLTIASFYGIGTRDFSDQANYDYKDSKLIKYLNEDLIALFDEPERKLIPYFDVEVNGEILKNQRAYLPWGIDSASNDYFAGSAFWSAMETKDYNNSFKGASDIKNLIRYRDQSKVLYASYYLRNSDTANNLIRFVEGGSGRVEKRADWDFYGKGVDWNQWNSYDKIEVGLGLRPITKLDMSSVVYAYPFKQGVFPAPVSDAEGYIYGKMIEDEWGNKFTDASFVYEVDDLSYKLSVLGANNGADVGILSGIPSSQESIKAGQKLVLENVKSSKYGDDYRVAYKIVGDVDGQREIVKYGEMNTSSSPQDLEIYANELETGQYKVYVWLQEYSERNSYRAGRVENFNLEIKPVEIPAGITDGVLMPRDGYIYYGSYKHAIELGDDLKTVEWEANPTPILWEIMGEEKIDKDRTDGYLTLMSRYILDTSMYSATSHFLGGQAPYHNTTINLWLNRKLSSSFNKGETNNIPLFTVSRADYNADDEVPSIYAETNITPNQKTYLPWAMKYSMDGQPFFNASGRAIFWSSNRDNSLMENTLSGKYDEQEEIPESSYGRLKNGEPVSYWIGASTAAGIHKVQKDGKFERPPVFGMDSKRHSGIKPITKLRQDGVVYVKEVGLDLVADDLNYVSPENGERHYKLTVIGGQGGKDVGELTGIPTEVEAEIGEEVELRRIGSSEYGGDYSIAYKIVGVEDGQRVILKYGEIETSEAKKRVKFDTADLEEGDYNLYTWLQKNNQVESDEAGVVYATELKVVPSKPIIDDGNYPGPGPIERPKDEDPKDKEKEEEKEDEKVDEKEEVEEKEEFKNKFVDVPAGSWYEKAVNYVAERGIVTGYSETMFGPNDNITRSQFITLIGRLAEMMGVNTEGYSSSFKDVQAGAYYAKYVAWGENVGIVKGYDENTFGVDDPITREQIATMLKRFVDYVSINLSLESAMNFGDQERISSWAYDSVSLISSSGLMVGSEGNFYPQRNTTRAEVAQLLMNFMVRYLSE